MADNYAGRILKPKYCYFCLFLWPNWHALVQAKSECLMACRNVSEILQTGASKVHVGGGQKCTVGSLVQLMFFFFFML